MHDVCFHFIRENRQGCLIHIFLASLWSACSQFFRHFCTSASAIVDAVITSCWELEWHLICIKPFSATQWSVLDSYRSHAQNKAGVPTVRLPLTITWCRCCCGEGRNCHISVITLDINIVSKWVVLHYQQMSWINKITIIVFHLYHFFLNILFIFPSFLPTAQYWFLSLLFFSSFIVYIHSSSAVAHFFEFALSLGAYTTRLLLKTGLLDKDWNVDTYLSKGAIVFLYSDGSLFWWSDELFKLVLENRVIPVKFSCC